jgi:chromosome segregation protein
MRIEKLELIGFKSFADRTAFALNEGITCIVGPNGCGKSNIVDAFRWVLGEQSAKSLRGENMAEVIFNGSNSKKPKGMAEVTLTVSGMNGAAAGNGSGQGELTMVTRRLYRSGESEYMINKTPCRLKDIRDLFLDTGLDFKSYSILEQGRIGEIINSKPYERRFIIEEVAGVMKYKVRKAEALSKLESSRANLIRISDIITEVKKQLNILDRLARKAERYKKLSAEMHAIELKIARKEYERIREAHAVINEEFGSLREKEALLGSDISDTENRVESRRIVVLEKEKTLETVQVTYQTMEREIAEIERAVAVARNDISNLVEYRGKIEGREAERAARSAALSSRCDELRLSSEVISGEIASHAELLKEKGDTFRAAEEELAEKEEMIEEKRRGIFRVSEELSGLRNELGRQQSSLESLERKESTAMREADDSRRMLAEIEQSINVAESEIHGSSNELLLLKEKKEVLVREQSDAKTRLEERLQSHAVAREELASSVSRLDSLREIVFDSPTRELISESCHVALLATVSDVVDVEAEYEKAIESALSEMVDSFVVESEAGIESVVSAIRGKGLGKTAFIPAAPPELRFDSPTPEGIVGKALQFVRLRDGYDSLAGNLLGNVLVVRDLRSALAMRAVDRNHIFVTLEGEVVEPSGAVVIGGEKGIFRRRREIRELEETIEEKRGLIETLSNELQALQLSIREREEAVRTVDVSINNLEKDVSLSKATVERYSEEKERVSRKLAYLNLEIEETAREKSSLSAVIEGTGRQIQSVEQKKSDSESELLLLQEGISRKRSEMEEYRAEVTDLRLLVASKRERLDAIKNDREASLKTLQETEQKKTELAAERESVLARIAQREAGVLDQDVRLRQLVAEADTVRLDIMQRKEEIEKENESLLAVEQGLKSLRQQNAAVASRIAELDVQRTEHKLRIENLADNVRNNYGSEIEQIESAEVSQEEEARLAELRGKIQEMGPVNLGTLEEYDELRGRYEFMSGQHEDLIKSIAELEEAISKINSTTRKKLKEAYETLNAKFAEVFMTLFGGGRAELVLTDENNILESGIDIVVQPPGKKLQNIHLLSGGEKALTALSIQFASFLIKPTPLCILDEADAPLDESNTERYARMIEELSNETQFVVVTHNRTTMSVARNLYGITMEEAGVSRVISMQLAEVGEGVN